MGYFGHITIFGMYNSRITHPGCGLFAILIIIISFLSPAILFGRHRCYLALTSTQSFLMTQGSFFPDFLFSLYFLFVHELFKRLGLFDLLWGLFFVVIVVTRE